MAVNQSPEYTKAEEKYRAATTADERLRCLEEMLRLVPKHKASEKLQSQLKQKIKAAREEGQQEHKHTGGHRDIFAVSRQGAGQVVLLGEPNVGKSAILAALTDAKVEVADFPFSTHAAIPGMAYHEDVPIQLVDMPPLIDGEPQPGMINAYRLADVILLVIDLSAVDLLDQYERPLRMLLERNLRPVSTSVPPMPEGDPPVQPKRVLVVANKSDTPQATENFEGLTELCAGMKDLGADGLRMLSISAVTRDGLDEMMSILFDLLNVIRVYAKKPGKPADLLAPFILPKGGTVLDLARHIHRELAEHLKIARIWGGAVHDGQQVHHTHVLTDRNVLELHF